MAGLSLAVDATHGDIRIQFLVESALLVGAGGLAGVFGGITPQRLRKDVEMAST